MKNVDANFQDFNRDCYCKKTTRTTPYDAFFAKTQVFLSSDVVSSIEKSIFVLEKVIKSDAFKKSICKDSDNISSYNSVDGGVLMSYDFHIDGTVPKLIEINTNAGGAFLNYELLRATEASCTHVHKQNIENFEAEIVSMFKNEFAKSNSRQLKTIAIVDENPTLQFLYPEFLLCKNMLEKNGITTYIADPKDLIVEHGLITCEGAQIDMVYNRLTDFYFKSSENERLKEVIEDGAVVISPNARDHHLFADKVNFFTLEETSITGAVLFDDERSILKNTILGTKIVDSMSEEYLWTNRKKYFFKPYNGYGGRGAYNGKGLTKQVWENIKKGGYIAQEIIPANVRMTKSEDDGDGEAYKFDIRAYTYKGKLLLLAARMYQGQTTNFRTVGGGFASVMITSK